jgi:hypothetical protein
MQRVFELPAKKESFFSGAEVGLKISQGSINGYPDLTDVRFTTEIHDKVEFDELVKLLFSEDKVDSDSAVILTLKRYRLQQGMWLCYLAYSCRKEADRRAADHLSRQRHYGRSKGAYVESR